MLTAPGCEGHVEIGRSAFVSPDKVECGTWDLAEHGMHTLGRNIPAPGLVGLEGPLVGKAEDCWRIEYDIIAFAYWMLARVEEVGAKGLDAHDRFPGNLSHAHRHGYLHRPIVDEWFELLREIVRRQWSRLELNRHEFRLSVTHDVDRPARYGFRKPGALVKAIAGDALLRRKPSAIVRGPLSRVSSRRSLPEVDPYNTFDWIMDASEARGLRSAFYFICGRTDPRKDADYEPEHPAIRDLMRRIHARGHEIGLHPSYMTYRDPSALAAEASRLRRVMAGEGIRQQEIGGRMHYLRWAMPDTLRGIEAAGLAYDCSLGYADLAGFRGGTCREYQAFDPVGQRILDVRIRPLVAMEGTVLAPGYMGLDFDSAAKVFHELKSACRSVGGCFSLLWHNSELDSGERRALYVAVLDS